MNNYLYDNLQIREVFHIEFLKNFTKKIKPSFYAVKGGVNMRLFFDSVRYSEDMDLDINKISVYALRDTVMKIIGSSTFLTELKSFGVEKVLPPDITKAKQTETTQRFKIHLITHQGEDLFTKIEFSRRRSSGNTVVELIQEKVLRRYGMSPLIVSHYDAETAVNQKIGALANRKAVQARDIFDIYILSTQVVPNKKGRLKVTQEIRKVAGENVFSVSFHRFRDTVLNYFSEEDRAVYENKELWDEIRLKVNGFICENNK